MTVRAKSGSHARLYSKVGLPRKRGQKMVRANQAADAPEAVAVAIVGGEAAVIAAVAVTEAGAIEGNKCQASEVLETSEAFSIFSD